MKSENSVIYLALGDYHVSQAITSILSLIIVYHKKKPAFKILVYTDNIEKFVWMMSFVDLDLRVMTSTILEEMTGPHRYFLRAKIVLMKTLLDEINSNLIYLDTDTIHLKKIDSLFTKIQTGVCYLHCKEWALSRGRKANPQLCPTDLNFHLASGSHVTITGKTDMWNSGVIGISTKQKEFIYDALELNDKFYEINPSFHAEQFCLGIILNGSGNLLACRKYIYHYWHNKEIANRFILKIQKTFQLDDLETSFRRTKNLILKLVFLTRLNNFYHRLKVSTRKNRFFYWIYCICVKKILRYNIQ